MKMQQGHKETKNARPKISSHLDEDIFYKVRTQANLRGKSMSSTINYILRSYYDGISKT